MKKNENSNLYKSYSYKIIYSVYKDDKHKKDDERLEYFYTDIQVPIGYDEEKEKEAVRYVQKVVSKLTINEFKNQGYSNPCVDINVRRIEKKTA